MRSRPLYDVVALFTRLAVGVVFIAHGWQKIESGITATAESFDTMGVPFPTGSAVYSTFAEMIGGTLLILGVGLPVVGSLLFVDMLGAFVFVHADQGLFMVDDNTRVGNGFELVIVLGLASLLFAVGDGGRLSLDHMLFSEGRPGRMPRRMTRRQREEEAEEEGTSFVEALREAEEAPAPSKTSKSSKGSSSSTSSSRSSSSRSSSSRSASSSSKTLPEAAARSSSPSSTTGGQARLASDIVSGSEDDTLVAGRRKSSRRRRSDTQPMKRDAGGDK